jgi:hypothetical protein
MIQESSDARTRCDGALRNHDDVEVDISMRGDGADKMCITNRLLFRAYGRLHNHTHLV